MPEPDPPKLFVVTASATSEARKRAMASAVPSCDPSSTTITCTRCSRGDSPKTCSRPRLVSMRYCSLYAGTITERLVLARFRSVPSIRSSAPDARRSRPVFSGRLPGDWAIVLVVSSAIQVSILFEYYGETVMRRAEDPNRQLEILECGPIRATPCRVKIERKKIELNLPSQRQPEPSIDLGRPRSSPPSASDSGQSRDRRSRSGECSVGSL